MPKVSVLIPTLNAENVLEDCLKSVRSQNFNQNDIEIIISDGGSTDNTLEIAKKYQCKIVKNPLKTGEAGKMAALKEASGEYVALIDSDNILPDENWLNQMINPLVSNPDYPGSEPWSYTLRKRDGYITRYCALIGMNDPLCHFIGNYDRINQITGKWTEVEHHEKDAGDFLLLEFKKNEIPTIGANGTVFRTEFLRKYAKGEYLFDIDILSLVTHNEGSVKFIKIKNGIIHTFCESSIKKFARKQRRRVNDLLFYKNIRVYNWTDGGIFTRQKIGMFKFIISCLTLFPLLAQTLIGYYKKPDSAWLFHPIACWITLWEYSTGVIKSIFIKKEQDRSSWKQ